MEPPVSVMCVKRADDSLSFQYVDPEVSDSSTTIAPAGCMPALIRHTLAPFKAPVGESHRTWTYSPSSVDFGLASTSFGAIAVFGDSSAMPSFVATAFVSALIEL